MNRFFQDPVANAILIVAPARRPGAIGKPCQFNQDVAWLADFARVNQFFCAAPERRETEFMPNGQNCLGLVG